jgi:altronate dehydratase
MTVCLNLQDSVAVALMDLAHGDLIDPGGMISNANVPAGHKIAICEIKAHDPVRKYGQIIGFASNDIQPGDHVHTHNLEMGEIIFRQILEIASGKQTRSELLGFGDNEFVPWQMGPVM